MSNARRSVRGTRSLSSSALPASVWCPCHGRHGGPRRVPGGAEEDRLPRGSPDVRSGRRAPGRRGSPPSLVGAARFPVGGERGVAGAPHRPRGRRGRRRRRCRPRARARRSASSSSLTTAAGRRSPGGRMTRRCRRSRARRASAPSPGAGGSAVPSGTRSRARPPASATIAAPSGWTVSAGAAAKNESQSLRRPRRWCKRWRTSATTPSRSMIASGRSSAITTVYRDEFSADVPSTRAWSTAGPTTLERPCSPTSGCARPSRWTGWIGSPTASGADGLARRSPTSRRRGPVPALPRDRRARELVVEAGVPVGVPVHVTTDVFAATLPAGRYVVATHRGPPDGLVAATAEVLASADSEGCAGTCASTQTGGHGAAGWRCSDGSTRSPTR